jgi:hypothetical protein
MKSITAAEAAVAEQREVEHRQALMALEQDERHEPDCGDREHREDPAGGPAVRVRLDERVAEREEPDRRRDQAG